MSNKVDETLETAALRNFVVSLCTKPGMKPYDHRVVVVKAHSIAAAKEQAIVKIKHDKRHRFTKKGSWVFLKVEDASTTPIVETETE
jgi:hypothetical protein